MSWISAFLGNKAFEWWAGIRRKAWLWVSLYLLALCLTFLPFVSLALLWLLVWLNASFFNYGESLQILYTSGRTGRAVLRNKLRTYLLLTIVLSLPILFLYLVFHPEHWLWVVFALPAFGSLTGIAIVIKYKLYQPGGFLSVHSFLLALAGLSLLVPFLVPLMVFMWAYYYPQAVKNLNYYFHD